MLAAGRELGGAAGGAGLAHPCSVPYPSGGNVCLESKDGGSSAD